jgi:peroxiredoxin Q/BCP
MATFPAFSLAGSDGRTWTHADLKGRTTVIYFYPKDMTPGCTVESCGFRDHQGAITAKGAQVLGVSPDSLASHAKFIAKESLNFPLLADTEQVLAKALGVWIEKSMYGRKYMGIDRSTFIVGPDLTILREWRTVKVPGHVEEVIAALGGTAPAAPAKPAAKPAKPAAKAKPTAKAKPKAKPAATAKPKTKR